MELPGPPREPPDFSLVLGGPLYQMFRRAHLEGPTGELLERRVLFFIAITWLPLLILSAISGHLLGGPAPFLRGIATHVRFLIVVPVLVIAELLVHQRIRPMLKLFFERGIVTAENTPKFHAAIEAAMRVRDSIPLELGVLVFAFTVGHSIWMKEITLGTATWYGVPSGAQLHLTLPGYWMAFISVPIGQFILLRWYTRFLIWFWLLFRVSRLNLHLNPLHPDLSGGIGFLGKITYAFSPILFAQGALLAGDIAARILFGGKNLMNFKVPIVSLLGFFLLFILGPLLVFTPHLSRTKRHGLRKYGTLATSYVEDFAQKWLREGGKDEAILGTADIQSLADLANSYAVVRDMRAVPFALQDVTRLVAATAAPLLPLLLTIMPLEELLDRLVKILL